MNVTLASGARVENDAEHDVLKVSQSNIGFYSTIQAAVDAAPKGARIEIERGTYDETVTIGAAQEGVQLVGIGSFGDVVIAPSDTGAKALVVNGNNVTVVNINFVGEDGATAGVLVSGDQFRAYGCRFEMGNDAGIALHFKPGTDAQYAAGTHGSASIARVEGCEFCWAEVGIKFEMNESMACTQTLVKDCEFRNLSVNCIGEAGGSPIRNLMLRDCLFENGEDGTAPTLYLDLDTAGDTGVVDNCAFASATFASATIKLAAGVIPVACKTLAGVSVAVPG